MFPLQVHARPLRFSVDMVAASIPPWPAMEYMTAIIFLMKKDAVCPEYIHY